MEVDEEEFVSIWQYEGSDAPTVSCHRSRTDLLTKFRTVMSGKCGWTTVCQQSHLGEGRCSHLSAALLIAPKI